jgi:hypothetical protein
MTSLSSAVGAFSSLLGVASAGKEERSMAPEEAFFRDFDPAKSAGVLCTEYVYKRICVSRLCGSCLLHRLRTSVRPGAG